MNLRITPSVISNNTNHNVRLRNVELARLQQQISTGLRISRPSDDPNGYSAITSYRSQLNALSTEKSNIELAESQLSITMSHLQDASGIFVQAKEISLKAAQSIDDAERNALAIEVDHLIDRLLQTANASNGGEFLFGGASINSAPFELASGSREGALLRPVYLGSNVQTETVVSASITVATREVGTNVFFREGRGETLFLQNQTGAQVGAGTDSGIGRATLQVTHTSTSYGGASGIAAGTNSAGNDTALGNNTLEIIDTAGDGSSGTVSLNGGPPVAFASSDDNLEVTGPGGEVLFIDTQNIAAGFSGTVTSNGQAELSVDGGKSSVAVDYSSNQVVADSVTGAVTNVDSSQIKHVGDVHVEYGETADAFTVLLELKQDLLNERGLGSGQLSESFSRRIGEVDAIADKIFDGVGRQAADLQDLKILKTRNEDVQFEFEVIASNLESVDYASVATKLQESLNLLEFTYASSSSILQQSILNYI